jgi:hypothetical protein
MVASQHRFWRGVRNYVIGFIVTVLVLALAVVGSLTLKNDRAAQKTAAQQQKLAPFYVAPAGWQAAPLGTVFRSEPVGGVPGHATGRRILYRSARADGSPSVSGGLVFVPSGPAPAGGRPVLAWAHGTAGMGDDCAQSRRPDVEASIPGLANFLAAGWAVVATDYSGLGTAGTLQYLVGQAAARDVLYSIRAARTMPGVDASTRVALWGHSQGGASVLWTEQLARRLAPELQIVAAAAAAPAAELAILMQHQWNTVGGSLIATEALVGWPAAYPDLDVAPLWNRDAGNYRTIANKCIVAGLIDLEVRHLLGSKPIMKVNPLTLPAWHTVVTANTAPLPLSAPTYIAQGLDDPLVLPGSTATYVRDACAAGANVTANFIGDLGHMKAGFTAAPIVFTWLQQRFAGVPATSTCGTQLPVAPLGL